MPAFDLAAAAAELYAAAPGDFVAVRRRLAGEARSAGDRDAASALLACAKPIAAAAAVNALVRDRPDDVAALLGLGVRLRAAQPAMDAAALRTAADERRRAVDGLAAVAGRDDERLRATLTASVLDAGAARAVASGRLTGPLEGDGLAPVDTAGVVALPDLPALLEVPDAPPPQPPAERDDDEARRAVLRERAEAAGRAADDADRAADEADDALEARRGDARDARRRASELRRRLAEAEDALSTAEDALDAAERAAQEADRRRRDARRAADDAFAAASRA